MKNELKALVRELKGVASGLDAEDYAGTLPAPAAAARPAAAAVQNEHPVPVHKSKIHAPQTNLMSAFPEGADALAAIAEEIAHCKKCALGETRIKAVPGVGNPGARIMFIGEGPGYEEDHKGEPFVGRAGNLLDKIINAMGLQRGDVYIANAVKCHPTIDPTDHEKHGNDRPPSPQETEACHDYILRQIAAIKPEIIVALGGSAARALLGGGEKASLASFRKRINILPPEKFPIGYELKVVATYHPAALLRNPGWKKDTWDDIKAVMRELNLPLPAKTETK